MPAMRIELISEDHPSYAGSYCEYETSVLTVKLSGLHCALRWRVKICYRTYCTSIYAEMGPMTGDEIFEASEGGVFACEEQNGVFDVNSVS